MSGLAEPVIEAELWASFVSLLRSYAAAANLNLGEPVRVEEDGDAVAVVVGTARIVMRFDAENGPVIWERTGREAASGSFEFLPEGMIAIGGNTQDLDHVAIEFITALSQAGKEPL